VVWWGGVCGGVGVWCGGVGVSWWWGCGVWWGGCVLVVGVWGVVGWVCLGGGGVGGGVGSLALEHSKDCTLCDFGHLQFISLFLHFVYALFLFSTSLSDYYNHLSKAVTPKRVDAVATCKNNAQYFLFFLTYYYSFRRKSQTRYKT
jgi:hypothetical protein